jgi:hypothetical protein
MYKTYHLKHLGSVDYPYMGLLTFSNNISVPSSRISQNWSVFQQSSADRHIKFLPTLADLSI